MPESPDGLFGLHGALQILVVEDDALIAMHMEDILLQLGCKVVKAGRIAMGLDVIDTQHIDGAFLDVDVSGSSVLPIAENLSIRSIPFAFVTGSGPDHVPERFRNRPILSKPFAAPGVTTLIAEFALDAAAGLVPSL